MDAPKKQILFVDDDPMILDILKQMVSLHAQDWDLHFCQSADDALALLKTVEVDTVVTDVQMPGKDGLQLLTEIRASKQTHHLPVIILTGNGDVTLKRRALDLGATDLLSKPINRENLLARIRSAVRLKSYDDLLANQVETLEQMVKERTKELEAAQQEVVWRLAKACEYRDDDTGNHVVRVAWYSFLIAKGLGKDQAFTDLLFLTSPLHDIGKIGIPDNILLKEGRLTPEERKIIERHATMGHEILFGIPKAMDSKELDGLNNFALNLDTSGHPLLSMASSISQGHHERWDGSGYPQKLTGEAISIEARIVALADVYDALRSERPYKAAFSEGKALGIIKREAGHHFDPDIVEAFIANFDDIKNVNAQFSEASDAELI